MKTFFNNVGSNCEAEHTLNGRYPTAAELFNCVGVIIWQCHKIPGRAAGLKKTSKKSGPELSPKCRMAVLMSVLRALVDK
jgi:hypothetical protein